MSHRFFLDKDTITANKLVVGETLTLSGDQAHHAVHVMRFKVADEVVLFDGMGTEHVATIESVQKKSLSVLIQSSSETTPVLKTNITVAVALPKGDRQKFLIEKLVEIGASNLIPLKTKRSVAVPNEKVLGRMKKQVVEACKQCRRNHLMNIAAPTTISGLVESVDSRSTNLLADPYCDQSITSINSGERVLIAVGPEGGFDSDESGQLVDAGFIPVKIGSSILRIETACITAVSILGIGRGD